MEGNRATHIEPPPAKEVQDRLADLCAKWRASFGGLRSVDKKFHAVAIFHAQFLVLHPFLDGNGRTARTILMQQCLDLFGKANMALMNRGAAYYGALKAADAGDYKGLIEIIEPITR